MTFKGGISFTSSVGVPNLLLEAELLKREEKSKFSLNDGVMGRPQTKQTVPEQIFRDL